MKLRIGVVGLGDHWEKRYRPALRALDDRFEVRAVCDPVMLRAERAADELRASAVDGFQALARRSDVDAVLVLSRRWYGAMPVFAACEAGKAVYCCDGLDMDEAVAKRMKERIEASGVAFMAEFPRRLSPATLRLKELIATRLGPPKYVFSHIRIPAETKNSTALEESNTAAMHHVVQLIDCCRFVVGREPASVIGVAGWEDCAAPAGYRMLSLSFPPPDDSPFPTVAQISCGRYLPATWHEAITFRPPAELQVCCEKGVAFVDSPASLVWFDEAGRHHESLESERPVGEALFLQFYRSVTSLVRQRADLEDAWSAFCIMLRAKESFRLGQRLPIPTGC
jgi:predicted dehydrogenase